MSIQSVPEAIPTVSKTTVSKAARASSTPGVELVLPSTSLDAAITKQSMRLLGILQRRTWKRQTEVMQRRAVRGLSLVADPVASIDDSVVAAVDLAYPESWDERLEMLRIGTTAIAEGRESFVVRVRGWDTTELGVLVDGRAVTGAVFDAAMMISAGVEQFRQGGQPFVLLVSGLDDAETARLWSEMIAIAEDRLGIERGTIRIGSRAK